jgi:thiamine biosynthesis lipoprotein
MTDELRRRSFSAMGTICTVAATAERRDAFLASGALDAARAEVAACERTLSRFDPGSDLSRLNRAAGDWVAVDGRLLAALAAALHGRTVTHGRFDPTILPALTAAGYDRSFEQLTERVPAGLDGWHAGARIDIDADSGRARIEQGAAVDLGGIGKGFSAARALEAMLAARPALMGGLVDLGGDIAVCGSPPEGGHWRIDIADPREHEKVLGTLEIPHGGVATSGRDKRRFGPGQQLHHLIDPATGVPAGSGPLSVTVTAANATDAEVYATALGVTAVDDARELLAIRPDIAALLIPQFGDPVTIGRLPLAPNRPPARALVNTQVGQFQWH